MSNYLCIFLHFITNASRKSHTAHWSQRWPKNQTPFLHNLCFYEPNIFSFGCYEKNIFSFVRSWCLKWYFEWIKKTKNSEKRCLILGVSPSLLPMEKTKISKNQKHLLPKGSTSDKIKCVATFIWTYASKYVRNI